MQSDLGKLFVGGISWETNEERLKEYFSTFGEVIEAVIMKDRSTGRARGFGFIIFSDSAAADRVVKEKHIIDGRMVEAKKAVPRDDQNITSRNSSGVHGSPGPGRTRKIFVGGLASTVTESDFKKYFEQFGMVTDVVVMYDHNTQRPRGFGFITYDSEEAVDRVLANTFHELNGKMVEVKRAVPKELSPSPIRRPFGGYNYGLNRVNDFLNAYTHGYSPNSLSGYGVTMDGRFNRIASGRSGFPPFGSGFRMGMNFEPGPNTSYGGSANFSSNLSYGRGMNPYYISNLDRFATPVGCGGGNEGNTSLFSSMNLWGNGGLNSNLMEPGPGNIGGTLGTDNVNWASPSVSGPGAGNGPGNVGSHGYAVADNSYYLGGGNHVRNSGNNAAPTSSSYVSSNGDGYNGTFADLYGGNSIYEDSAWREATPEQDGWSSFSYRNGNATLDVFSKGSADNVGGYGVDKRMSNKAIPS